MGKGVIKFLWCTASIHRCLYRYTSRHWLEAPTRTSTENLASAGGRGYGSTHQCLPIRDPGPLVVEIAMTLSWSSAAVSEWVMKKNQLIHLGNLNIIAQISYMRPSPAACKLLYIVPTHRGIAMLSWPEWLVTYWHDYPPRLPQMVSGHTAKY